MPNAASPTSASAKPSRRWFQFSLRTFLLATVLIGCGCGWVMMKVSEAHRQEIAVKAIEARGAKVYYSDQMKDDGKVDVDAPPSTPQWLRRLVGDHFLRTAVMVDYDYRFEYMSPARYESGYGLRPGASDLLAIGQLDHLQYLIMLPRQITDEQLKTITGLRDLRWLELTGFLLSDEGMVRLESCPMLEQLRLDHTLVTADGIKHLQHLKKLKQLSLTGSPVNDDGLEVIATLPEIEMLGLYDTHVTADGLKFLARLPKLKSLTLNAHMLKGEGLKHLQAVKTLTELRLPDMLRINEVLRVKESLPNCEVIGH